MKKTLHELLTTSGYPQPQHAARAQTAVLLTTQQLAHLVQELVDYRVPASQYPERILNHFHDLAKICIYPHCTGGECGTHCRQHCRPDYYSSHRTD